MTFLQHILTIVLSILPVVLLFLLFRWLDRTRPEPRKALLVTMLLGMASCVPALFLEISLRWLLGDLALIGGRFIEAFVAIALVEEACKFAVVIGLIYRRRVINVNEVMDGIVYSICSGLGFGLIENFVFTYSFAFASPNVVLLRAFTAVPMHALCAGIGGYCLGRSRFVSLSGTTTLVITGVAIAVGIHGLYDWAVFSHNPYWQWEAGLLLTVATVVLGLLIRSALRLDDAILGRMSQPRWSTTSWPGQ